MPIAERWHRLGEFTWSANAGSVGEYLMLGDNTGEGTIGYSQRSVTFDDAKWVFRGDDPACGAPIVDDRKPTGNVVNPAKVSIGPIFMNFAAQASDGESGVSRVEFHIFHDGAWHHVGTDYSAPYGVGWSTPGSMPSQQLRFTIHVIDNAGNRAVDPGGIHYVQYDAPTGASNSLVNEARRDIGMPYPPAPYNRGCQNNHRGCGGPYHGFYLGVCTDLILDAYNSGAGFDIHAAIQKDASNPLNWFRYRWRSGRNAEDMRRYFVHNQVLLTGNNNYQPGDIGFFDWHGDGVTDHALLIASVDGNGRPLRVVDAPGSIQDRATPALDTTGTAAMTMRARAMVAWSAARQIS